MAPLWGLGRVIAAEHPELKCRLIDLDPEEPTVVEALLAVLKREEYRENEIALRKNSRLAPRLVRLPLMTPGTDATGADPSSEPPHSSSRRNCGCAAMPATSLRAACVAWGWKSRAGWRAKERAISC